MEGVHDDGHAGASGGEATEEAGFAAMGVDDVGAALSEVAGQGTPGLEIEPGMEIGRASCRERV